jgi:hypothetical protein
MSLTALYDSPGKRAFRELVLAVAKRDGCQTYGTFWGSGIDSRMAVDAGLEVTAAEIVRALHPAMDADASEHGYRAFHGRASRLTDRFDVFCADFCGNASPAAFRELGHIAALTDKWLAVVLTPDHQLDPSMQGEAALYTVPAWLTGATGFTLEYFTRYRRNGRGGVMFAALLARKDGRGVVHSVQPLQVARSISERGYWASRPMYRTLLLRHRAEPRTQRTRAVDAERYESRMGEREYRCQECGVTFVREHRTQRYCGSECRLAPRRRKSRAWYWRDPEAGRAYQRAYKARLRERERAAVSGTAAEAIEEAA